MDFQATEKAISNFNFTGSAIRLVEKLGEVGGINAFVDGVTLVIKNDNAPITGRLRVLSPSTGLIGIPQPNEQGVKVNMLFDNQTTIGGAFELISRRYPSFNGRYVIYKLGFNVTNRDTPFYLTAEGRRA